MKDRILCPIRGEWVSALPEEIVRQSLIRKMIGELGFPKSLLAVEKEIDTLLAQEKGLKKRLDLICYRPAKEGLAPLLVAECKAGPLTAEALRQALGYNASLGAPFVCLAGPSEIKTLWREGTKMSSVGFLPSYAQLMQAICL